MWDLEKPLNTETQSGFFFFFGQAWSFVPIHSYSNEIDLHTKICLREFCKQNYILVLEKIRSLLCFTFLFFSHFYFCFVVVCVWFQFSIFMYPSFISLIKLKIYEKEINNSHLGSPQKISLQLLPRSQSLFLIFHLPKNILWWEKTNKPALNLSFKS